WVLGPYGRAFLYVAKRHQDGVPLEQTAFGRRGIAADQVPYIKDAAYVTGARRYDMGERDHFISMEMAAVGMEMMAGWGQAAIEQRLAMLTERLSESLGNIKNARLPDPKLRAPHLLCVAFPSGMPDKLVENLAAERVYAAPRLGRLRISPHVYNDAEDVDRFVNVFRKLVS
ncbi:MAG TPA: aminotransferase, partial [Vineibacter sp.]|nr:aminotransferase [Vineibacter sp.]